MTLVCGAVVRGAWSSLRLKKTIIPPNCYAIFESTPPNYPIVIQMYCSSLQDIFLSHIF